jgi:large subunit ribosomal protein L21
LLRATICRGWASGLPGASVDLPALLLVDGEDVTTDADALAKVAVTGEVVGTSCPKRRTI